eukprot:366282-Chlamydomonas_euryale.AAC.17
MATKLFPKFSQGLANDPTTRRIWYGLAVAHDFESHDGMTEENLYQKIFASHFGQLAIIFLWTSDPVHVRPIAHAIWDPHFGTPAVEAFTRGGASGPVNIAASGVYQWWFTIGWLHLQPSFQPALSWFKDAESRLNHHLSGLFGVSSLAWTGHLVHVAIPESRGQHVGWDNFLSVLPHPQGLAPFWTGNWAAYAQNPDSATHAFGTGEGSGDAILTFLGGFHPQTQSLWLTDMAHHHLAIAVIFIVAGHMYRTNFGIGHRLEAILDAHTAPSGRLGAGHKGLALASVGTITSLVAQHIYSLPPYAYLAIDFTTQAALYTHHQYIAGFIMCGAFAHGAIFFIRDYDPEANKGNVLARILDHKEAIISHLSWVTLFLGFHTLGLYVHNDVMQAFGTPEKQILIEPVFAQWIQSAQVKGALDARGSKLMPDKKDFGYSFPCDGPGRGGTCDISAYDAFYLAVFWMLNTIGWVTFYWHWKHLTLWQVWAHEKTPLANLVYWKDKPVALSIVQARLVGLAHFSVGYIFTYAAFLIASTSGRFG